MSHLACRDNWRSLADRSCLVSFNLSEPKSSSLFLFIHLRVITNLEVTGNWPSSHKWEAWTSLQLVVPLAQQNSFSESQKCFGQICMILWDTVILWAAAPRTSTPFMWPLILHNCGHVLGSKLGVVGHSPALRRVFIVFRKEEVWPI